jgi:RHS repeat-associated protein
MHAASNLQSSSVPERSIELLPGQYFDLETNLSYNYFRDYDSGIGRYVESDPIGLRAGLNTYLYVRGRPLVAVDSLGLIDLGGIGTELIEGILTSHAVKEGRRIGKELCKTNPRDFRSDCIEQCLKIIPDDGRPSAGGSSDISQCTDACVNTYQDCKKKPTSSCPVPSTN